MATVLVKSSTPPCEKPICVPFEPEPDFPKGPPTASRKVENPLEEFSTTLAAASAAAYFIDYSIFELSPSRALTIRLVFLSALA
jgi:hypothetical protein